MKGDISYFWNVYVMLFCASEFLFFNLNVYHQDTIIRLLAIFKIRFRTDVTIIHLAGTLTQMYDLSLNHSFI